MESKSSWFRISDPNCESLVDFNNFVYFKPLELLKINSSILADGIQSP